MAEEKTKAPAAATEQPAKKKSKTWLILAVLMLVEGVGVFFVAKMFSGGPEHAAAEGTMPEGHDAPSDGHDGHAPAAPQNGEIAEIALCDSKTFNNETGKTVLIHIRISALVAGSDVEKAKKLVEAKQARLDDRINTVIRSSEPKHLNEPGLETVKRRVKYECDRIFENETLIREILIPYMVHSGSGV